MSIVVVVVVVAAVVVVVAVDNPMWLDSSCLPREGVACQVTTLTRVTLN
jgi:hypothetical protein